MTRRLQWGILGAIAGVYLTALGLLTGVVSERFRFDGMRTSILQQFDEATQRARAHAMAWEQELRKSAPPTAPPGAETPDTAISWTTYLQMTDAAVAQRDFTTADRALREAQAAALRTRAWRPLLEVGDAAIRVSAADARPGPHVARARELYLAALTRARSERSVEGVLQVADAFHGIGDYRVVEQCLVIAERLGASAESDAIVRLRTLTEQALDVRAAPRLEP